MHRFVFVLCAAILAADGSSHHDLLIKCTAAHVVVDDVVDFLCYYGVPQPGADGFCKLNKENFWDLVIATDDAKFRGGLFENGERAVSKVTLKRWASAHLRSCLVMGDEHVSTECLFFIVQATHARALRRAQWATERDVIRDIFCCDAPLAKKSPLCAIESGITLAPLAKVAHYNNLTKVPMNCVLEGDDYCI